MNLEKKILFRYLIFDGISENSRTCQLCGTPIQSIFCVDEFSQNFNVEYLENLECVKTMPETNFKIFLKIKIQGFCDKEILHIF